MSPAAIFDLDRTLIAGSSSEVFSRVLTDVGVSVPSVPGQALFFRFYERFGEDPVSMRLARQASSLFAGTSVATVEAAGLLAADVLASKVFPHARSEIERHRETGARLVLATTSPFDLVWPLAQALGFDELICTRYRSVDGVYDGELEGDFVWGADKAGAVARWAGANSIDLTLSTAYSDSWYDLPLLELVGNPVATNPDVRLRATATSRRWQIRSFERPAGVPSLAGIEGQEWLFPLLYPPLSVFAEIDLQGTDLFPSAGPAIVAANHRSYFDPLALGYLAAALDRPFRFMAKREVFETPIVGAAIAALGTISVDRSATDKSASFDAAAAALDAGEIVVMFPQATIPRGDAFDDPKLSGRTGAVRLAQQTGAPLVPVGLTGTEEVWPRDARLPRIDVVGVRPQVQIRVGEPYHVSTRAKPKPQTRKLMDKIASLVVSEVAR